MIRKIKQWWIHRYHPEREPVKQYERIGYSYEELEKAYKLGYNDGKRDGLSVARQQATKSLKEILWQQNNQKKKSK